jgi:hypothetical protein
MTHRVQELLARGGQSQQRRPIILTGYKLGREGIQPQQFR